VGTDHTGLKVIGNRQSGESILREASENVIGGSSDGEANQISGNFSSGVAILLNASANTVKGNFIGTDPGGLCDLDGAGNCRFGNGSAGVLMLFNVKDNVIGGTGTGDGNIISGNVRDGVAIFDVPDTTDPSSGNRVIGNFIGTDVTQALAIPNKLSGVLINNSTGNSIGGTEEAAGNIVAFNGQAGVTIRSEDEKNTRNVILGNSIHSNGGIGIDLNNDGVTKNDASGVTDADEGPNGLQNFPVLVGAENGSLTVSGRLPTKAGDTYRVEIFSNETCDPTGFGEGETFVGAFDVQVLGDGAFQHTFADFALPSQHVLAATATNVDETKDGT
jgi:hypothetical protein